MKLIWAESVCGGRHLGGLFYCKIYRYDLIIIRHRKRWDVTLRENVILPGHPTRIPILHHVCWAVVDPGYHTQGCQRKTYYLFKFPRKLHRIERNWNEKGRPPWIRPMRRALCVAVSDPPLGEGGIFFCPKNKSER